MQQAGGPQQEAVSPPPLKQDNLRGVQPIEQPSSTSAPIIRITYRAIEAFPNTRTALLRQNKAKRAPTSGNRVLSLRFPAPRSPSCEAGCGTSVTQALLPSEISNGVPTRVCVGCQQLSDSEHPGTARDQDQATSLYERRSCARGRVLGLHGHHHANQGFDAEVCSLGFGLGKPVGAFRGAAAKQYSSRQPPCG